MTYSFAIECATTDLSLSLAKDKKIIGEINNQDITLTHSEALLTLIDQLLSHHQLSINQIDQFVMSHGPGGFTSIRVGLSTLYGLLMPHPKKFSLLSTLQVQAQNYFENNSDQPFIISTLKAGRGRIYFGGYSYDPKLQIAQLDKNFPDSVIDKEGFLNSLKSLDQAYEIIGAGTNLLDDIENDETYYPKSSHSLKIALIQNQWSNNLIDLKPNYLQEPDIG